MVGHGLLVVVDAVFRSVVLRVTDLHEL